MTSAFDRPLSIFAFNWERNTRGDSVAKSTSREKPFKITLRIFCASEIGRSWVDKKNTRSPCPEFATGERSVAAANTKSSQGGSSRKILLNRIRSVPAGATVSAGRATAAPAVKRMNVRRLTVGCSIQCQHEGAFCRDLVRSWGPVALM